MTATATIEIDGETVEAVPGIPLAAVLFARGKPFRFSPGGEARGLYCGMGVCFECRVEADGRMVRSCMVPIRPGMVVTTGRRER